MKTSRNGNGNAPKASLRKPRKLALSVDETRIVLDACRRYRHSLPVYLASSQIDLRLLDMVIRKLS